LIRHSNFGFRIWSFGFPNGLKRPDRNQSNLCPHRRQKFAYPGCTVPHPLHVCALSACIVGRFLFDDVAKITTSAATARAISSGPSESFIIANKYIMNVSRRCRLYPA
jgi:hypothetical protein